MDFQDIESPNDDLPFYHVRTARAHEEVVDQVTFAIRSGLLRVGDRLPTIDTLTKLTGVSKPVVTEAVKVLRDNGVLESKRGATGGVTVVSEDVPVTLIRIRAKWREAALAELIEARRPVEMELALLAGKRATQEDLDAMRDSVERFEQAVAEDREPSTLRNLNHLFHYSFGRAAKSEMLAYYQHQILGRIEVLLHEYYINEEDPELVIETHWDTFEAIKSRDEDEIERSMEWHLSNLEELIQSPQLTRWLDSNELGSIQNG